MSSSKETSVAESRIPIQESASPSGAEAASSIGSRWQAGVRALRHRNFQLFFGGQLISLIGTWMQSAAQSWLVYRLTGSALLLGSVGFASQIPVFLFAPLGGMTADRVNRRDTVISTQAAAMLLASILAALTLLHRVQVWHVFVLASLLGVVNAFDIPGRQSFLVDMVGRDDLMNAIALNSSMFNGARVIGPAIAGILVARIGEGWCFFANAVSYIAVIIGLMMMRVHSPARPSTASPLEHMMEGFHFVNRTAPIRALLLLLGVVSLVGMPYVVLSRVWGEPGGVCDLAHVLGFGGSVAARGLHDHAADGVLEHADPGDGARCAARAGDGRVLDDVHGHGSNWSSARRCAGRAFGRAGHRSDRGPGIYRGRVLVWIATAEDPRGGAAPDRGPGPGRRRAAGDDGASGRRLNPAMHAVGIAAHRGIIGRL